MSSPNINPVVITNKSDGSSFFNKLRSQTISNIGRSSSDIVANQSTNGTSFQLQEDLRIGTTGLNYDTIDESIYTLPIGSDPLSGSLVDTITNQVVAKLSVFGASDSQWWNKDKAYKVGDITRVEKTYYAGQDVDNNNVSQSIYVFPGTYICVSDVPYNYSTADKAIIAGLGDPGLIGQITASYRIDGVCYAPVWKHHDNPYNGTNEEPMLGGMTSIMGGNGKGRYWELISLLPTKVTLCTDTGTVEMLVCGAVIPTSNDGLPTV